MAPLPPAVTPPTAPDAHAPAALAAQTAARGASLLPLRAAARRRSVVELSVALTALVVSVASLFVARHQAQVMDRQLAASVWPLLQVFNSNLTEDGRPGLVRLSLLNAGVGPLRIRSFRVAYKGRATTGVRDLLVACCANGDTTSAPPRIVTSYTQNRVVRAGEQIHFVSMYLDPRRRPDVFEAFDRARDDIAVTACYCSVLGDCWVQPPLNAEPEPVRSCEAEAKRPQFN